MATDITDYTLSSDPYWADEYAKFKRDIEGVATWFRAKVAASGAAAEPGDFLAGIELGDSAAHNDVRLYYDGTSIVFQQNTGSEATPSWSTRWTINATTGAVTLLAGLTMGAALDMAGFNITNSGTVNGISPAAHASRHLPGGADALTVAAPSDIGSANAAGAAATFNRADHVHRGVRSVQGAFGDITIAAGTGVEVSGTSTVTVAAIGNTYLYADLTSPANITLTATTPTAIGGFADLAFPGVVGSTYDYILEFSAPLTTQTGADQTLFQIHVGTAGTVADAVIGHCNVETAASGDPGIVYMRAHVVNASSTSKITVSYDSTTGSRHILEGGTDGFPILTITRLTSYTSI